MFICNSQTFLLSATMLILSPVQLIYKIKIISGELIVRPGIISLTPEVFWTIFSVIH